MMWLRTVSSMTVSYRRQCWSLGILLLVASTQIGHAIPLQPKLLGSESYGESFTVIADLKGGAYILTQFVFTNAGFGDGKAACRALVVAPGSVGINDAVRLKRRDWRYVQATNLLQVGRCHLSSTNGQTMFTVKTDKLAVDLLFSSEAQSIRPPGHRVNVDDDEFFASRILIPWSSLTAIVKTKRGAFEDTGMGYLDHTHSNTRLPKVADRWIRVRGFYGPQKALIELRYPPKKNQAKAWIYTAKTAKPVKVDTGGLIAKDRGGKVSFSFPTPVGTVQIDTSQVLYRYRPAKEWGLLGRLAKPWVGDPKTTTYRATMTWPDGTQTKGILEQASIRDE